MAVLDILATLPSADVADMTLTDSVISGDLHLESSIGTDCDHLFIGERFALHPSSLDSVSHVVGLVPVAQVLNVDAGWVVAGVENVAVGLPVNMLHDNTVSKHGAVCSSYTDAPISVGIAGSAKDKAISYPNRESDHLVVSGGSSRKMVLVRSIERNTGTVPLVMESTEAFAVARAVANGAGHVSKDIA